MITFAVHDLETTRVFRVVRLHAVHPTPQILQQSEIRERIQVHDRVQIRLLRLKRVQVGVPLQVIQAHIVQDLVRLEEAEDEALGFALLAEILESGRFKVLLICEEK